MPITLSVRISFRNTSPADRQEINEYFPDVPPNRFQQLGEALLEYIAITPFAIKRDSGASFPPSSFPLGTTTPTPSFASLSSTPPPASKRAQGMHLSTPPTFTVRRSPQDTSPPTFAGASSSSSPSSLERREVGEGEGHRTNAVDEEKTKSAGGGGDADHAFLFGVPYFMEEQWDERAIALCVPLSSSFSSLLSPLTCSTSAANPPHDASAMDWPSDEKAGHPPMDVQPFIPPASPFLRASSHSEDSDDAKGGDEKSISSHTFQRNVPIALLARPRILRAVTMGCSLDENEKKDPVSSGECSGNFTASYRFAFGVPAALFQHPEDTTRCDTHAMEKKGDSDRSLHVHPPHPRRTRPSPLAVAPLTTDTEIQFVGDEEKCDTSPSSTRRTTKMTLVFVVQLVLPQMPSFLCPLPYGRIGDPECTAATPISEQVAPDSLLRMMALLVDEKNTSHANALPVVPSTETTTTSTMPSPPYHRRPTGGANGSAGKDLTSERGGRRTGTRALAMLGCGGHFPVQLFQPLHCHSVTRLVSTYPLCLLLSCDVVNGFEYPIHVYDAVVDWYTTRVLSSRETVSSSFFSASSSEPWIYNVNPHQRAGPRWKDLEIVQLLPHILTITPTITMGKTPSTTTIGEGEKEQVSRSSSTRLLPGKWHTFSFQVQLLPSLDFSLTHPEERSGKRSVAQERGDKAKADGSRGGSSMDGGRCHAPSAVSFIPSSQTRSVIGSRTEKACEEDIQRVLSSSFSTSLFFDYEVESERTKGRRLTRSHVVRWSFS